MNDEESRVKYLYLCLVYWEQKIELLWICIILLLNGNNYLCS